MASNENATFQSPEFQRILAQYEAMLHNGQTRYFDLDDLLDIADYYACENQYDKAFEAVEHALALHPADEEALALKGTLLVEDGKLAEARTLVDSLPSNGSYSVELLQALVNLEEGKGLKAKAVLKKMEQRYDGDEAFYRDAAYLYLDRNLPEDALRWVEKALRINPHNASLMMDQAEAFAQAGSTKLAAEWYEQATDEDPFCVDAWSGLGRARLLQEQLEAALEAFDFALAIDPDHTQSLMLKASTCFQMENFKQASDLCAACLEQDANNAYALFLKGMCHKYAGEDEQAIALFEQAVKLSSEMDSFHTELSHSRALCYTAIGQYEKAIEILTYFTSQYPADADVDSFILLGELLLHRNQKGDAEKASVAFWQALEKNSFEELGDYVRLMFICHTHRKTPFLVNLLEDIVHHHPNLPEALITLSLAYHWAGDTKKSDMAYAQALQADPGIKARFDELSTAFYQNLTDIRPNETYKSKNVN